MTIVRVNDCRQKLPIPLDFGGLGLNSFTAYSLIAGDGSDPKKIAFLGTGNSGQTLLGASSAPPVWTDSDAVSGMQQILSQQTISGSPSVVNVTGLTGFDAYIINFQQIDISSGATLQLRFSTNNGSTYLSGTNYGYAIWTAPSLAGTGASSQAQIVLSPGGNLTTNSAYNNSFTLKLFNIGANVANNGVIWRGKYWGSSAGFYVEGAGELNGTTGAVNAIRFLLSAGTFDGGLVTSWGIKS
jgi:hypothetical protein